MKKLFLLIFLCIFVPLAGCATAQSEEYPEGRYNHFSDQLTMARLLLTREAATFIRTPYASPPNVPYSFDCSSFVSHVYDQFGHTLPRTTSAYANVGTRIDWEDALPGDILVFVRERGSNALDHVAILWKKSESGRLAGSWIIHSASINTGKSMQRGHPDTRTGVVITQLGLRGDGIIENEYFYRRYVYCIRVLD